MAVSAPEPREDIFRRILCQLAAARQTASDLENVQIDHLLDMAIMSVVAQWEGIDLSTDCDSKLETVTRYRLRQLREQPIATTRLPDGGRAG